MFNYWEPACGCADISDNHDGEIKCDSCGEYVPEDEIIEDHGWYWCEACQLQFDNE